MRFNGFTVVSKRSLSYCIQLTTPKLGYNDHNEINGMAALQKQFFYRTTEFRPTREQKSCKLHQTKKRRQFLVLVSLSLRFPDSYRLFFQTTLGMRAVACCLHKFMQITRKHTAALNASDSIVLYVLACSNRDVHTYVKFLVLCRSN